MLISTLRRLSARSLHRYPSYHIPRQPSHTFPPAFKFVLTVVRRMLFLHKTRECALELRSLLLFTDFLQHQAGVLWARFGMFGI